jgi:NNP family nitrate/nitrite transporter-like MFS transporter
MMGSMDTFVPGQYWITCHFTRQVVGTAMAISGGWGASGAGFVQLLVGTVIYPTCVYITDGDTNLAWRISLIVPAILALYCAAFFYKYSDDCPLGNYNQVKRAGLMVERSAVDSFRSGAMNMNSWILFLQ